MAALQVMGVSNDFPLRNPEQIPYPDCPPQIQNPTGVKEEEDTSNMRELVQEIDSHVDLVDLKITDNLNVVPNLVPSQLPDFATQPTVDTIPT